MLKGRANVLVAIDFMYINFHVGLLGIFVTLSKGEDMSSAATGYEL